MSQVKMFLGKRGSGKSTLMAKCLKAERRLIVFDTIMESVYDKLQPCRNFLSLAEIVKSDSAVYRVSYRNPNLTFEEDFSYVSRLVYAGYNLCFAVEEIEMFCSSHTMPKALEMIVSLGRHKALSLFCTSRRPASVHPLIRSQANEIYSFVQTEPRDVDWLTEVMGNMAYDVPNLKGHQFIKWSDTDMGRDADRKREMEKIEKDAQAPQSKEEPVDKTKGVADTAPVEG